MEMLTQEKSKEVKTKSHRMGLKLIFIYALLIGLFLALLLFM